METTQTPGDPTERTLDTVQREVERVKELLEARLLAIEKAGDVRSQSIDQVPADVKEQIAHLKDLHAERFNSIAKQFEERDVRGEQASTSSGQALAAALQAAKELVGAQAESQAAAAVKSETSFTKQIDQIGTIIQTLEKALDARITELKERIDRGEGNTVGIHDANAESRNVRGERRSDTTLIVSLGVAVISFISVAAAIVAIVTR